MSLLVGRLEELQISPSSDNWDGRALMQASIHKHIYTSLTFFSWLFSESVQKESEQERMGQMDTGGHQLQQNEQESGGDEGAGGGGAKVGLGLV